MITLETTLIKRLDNINYIHFSENVKVIVQSTRSVLICEHEIPGSEKYSRNQKGVFKKCLIFIVELLSFSITAKTPGPLRCTILAEILNFKAY